MLTADLVRPRLRQHGSSIAVLFVEPTDSHCLATAADLIDLFRAHVGRTLSVWETALDEYEGERMDYVVIRGLAKVLTDAAAFAAVETVLPPAEIRERLFALGPAFSLADLFRPQTRVALLDQVAQELNTTPIALEQALFADRPVEYVLGDVGQD